MYFNFKNIFYIILFSFLFSACTHEQSSTYEPLYSDTPPLNKKRVYIFGVHPLHNPKRLFEVYQPMVSYINSQLKNSELRLEASRDYASFDKKLFSGYFDFALPNPYQTIVAIDKGYDVFGKMGDDENFRGIILVRKDSTINSVLDLKGKKVSYPAPTALAATIMPQWYLHQRGIDINKDIQNIYVGSQESSIMNVYLGKSDASSTWPPPWRAFIKEHPEVAAQVTIKWQTPSLVNNSLVARKDVPQELINKVGKIIFSLHTHDEGKKILEEMELTHYESANTQTYDSIKKFINDFEAEVRPVRNLETNDEN